MTLYEEFESRTGMKNRDDEGYYYAFYIWVANKCEELKEENELLKKQVRWIPVSNPPKEAGMYEVVLTQKLANRWNRTISHSFFKHGEFTLMNVTHWRHRINNLPENICPKCGGSGKICAGAFTGCDNDPRECDERNNCGEYELVTCMVCEGDRRNRRKNMSTKSFTRNIILSPDASKRLKNIMNKSKENADTCTWVEDHAGLWWTECHEIHEFIDGTPSENLYKYCPYCGKALNEKKYKEQS